MTSRDRTLFLLRRDGDRDESSPEREPAAPPSAGGGAPAPVDAAESIWDPWLLALARMKALEEVRPN